MNYLFPLFFYGLVGALMTGLNPAFKDTIIPAMMVVAMMASLLLGLPNPIVAARMAGIYRSYKINGVPAINILSAPVLSTSLHSFIVYAIITLTAPPFFGAQLPDHLGWFVLLALISTFGTASLGLLIGVVSRNERATVFLAQIIFLPSMMLGGLMMPSEVLPKTLGKIALLLPSTHIMNAFKGLAFGLPTQFDPLISVAALAASAILSFALSVYLFQWDSQVKSKRTVFLGLLALLPLAVTLLIVP
jgi:ABC-2 type transport system permease protein